MPAEARRSNPSRRDRARPLRTLLNSSSLDAPQALEPRPPGHRLFYIRIYLCHNRAAAPRARKAGFRGFPVEGRIVIAIADRFSIAGWFDAKPAKKFALGKTASGG